MSVHGEVKRVTTHTLAEMKEAGEKIAMLTAYDFTMARILDRSGVDVLLVGDSASNVMAGHETTLPITLDQMIYHASSVVRAVQRALVVVDLPFGSYQGNSKEALQSTIRIMKEAGAHAVKLEGGREVVESVVRILTAGVPVMGHLGLTPQSIYKFGTYSVRAREERGGRTPFGRCLGLARGRLFWVGARENPFQTRPKSGVHLEHSGHWHWRWIGGGWAGPGDARYAGFEQRVFTPISQTLPSIGWSGHRSGTGLYP